MQFRMLRVEELGGGENIEILLDPRSDNRFALASVIGVGITGKAIAVELVPCGILDGLLGG